MSRIKFLNTQIDNVTMEEAITRIDKLIASDRNSYVVTPNVDHIVKLETDAELQKIYEDADLILTDGMPLIWISKLKSTPIKEKMVIPTIDNNTVLVGTYSPSYGFENNQDEINHILELINNCKPDILAVGLGAPKQEKFIYKYKEKLKVPVSLAIGASIDFEAGNIKRAPIWMQKNGLEWFYRLCMEPKRMFRRYLVDDLKILGISLKYKN